MGAFKEIEDPAAWQKKIRKDRNMRWNDWCLTYEDYTIIMGIFALENDTNVELYFNEIDHSVFEWSMTSIHPFYFFVISLLFYFAGFLWQIEKSLNP